MKMAAALCNLQSTIGYFRVKLQERVMTHIGYILRSYPRLSQTFIVNEIRALEQLGLPIHIFAITNPREPIIQPQVVAVRAALDYLELATQRHPIVVLAEQLQAACAAPRRYFAALRYVVRRRDLGADYSAGSRYACFIQAVYLARLLDRARRSGQPISHLHAHFAHDPTLIALLAHMLTGISYSFTAHARDLYQLPAAALVDRIAAASAVVTCCGTNIDYLTELAPEGMRGKLRLIHHGVDLSGFQPAAQTASVEDAPLILSIGRLVEKKGFPDLVYACAELARAGYRFRCTIYGDGPLHDALAALIAQLGLADRVTLAGACSQPELLPAFQSADIFALAPFVTDDGDRDGIPNVLVEAMACALPVVTTEVAGIPELVQHDHNGLLVAPHDAAGLAAALAALLDDPARCARLGAAARRTVAERFDLRMAAQQLLELFGRATAPSADRLTAGHSAPAVTSK
jgi:glycosyltransferase involved in cell wall biosynthesis